MKMPVENADFGKTADDYLTHRLGFPQSMYDALAARDIACDHASVVDLGTGTGALARGLTAMGNEVIGIDSSPEMLASARLLNTPEAQIDYRLATAEATGLSDSSVDIVSAGQCWHWFDGVATCHEIKRILKPGGIVLITYFDWIPLNGNVVRRTEELIEQHNPAWRGGNQFGIHPACFRDLGEAGFEDLVSFTFDEAASYSHVGWRGRIRASAGIAATLSPVAVQRFDDQLSEMLVTGFPGDPLNIPHRIFVLTATFPG